MCDDDGGPIVRKVLDGVLDERLGFCIDGGRGLVQDENRRILEDRPRDRETLFLTTREPDTTLANNRIVSVRQTQNERFSIGRARCFNQFFFRCIRSAEQDVVTDRSVEEEYVLEYTGDILSEKVELQVADVVTTDANGPRLNIVESRDEVRNGGLPCSGWTHKCNNLSGVYWKADVLQDGNPLVVGEVDMIEVDPPVDLFRRSGIRSIHDLGFDGEQVEDASGTGCRFLQNVVHRGELQKGLINVAKVNDEHEEVGDRDLAVERHLAS